jgi:dienelactone hydrolase
VSGLASTGCGSAVRLSLHWGEAATEAWVVLHGYASSPGASCAVSNRSPGPGLVVAPEALSRFYRQGGVGIVGASWMTREDREAEIRDYLAYLEQVRATVIPPVPLTLLGFSQGVATAVRWAASGTAAPKRLVCWGGLLPEDVPAAGLSAFPVTFVVGERDEWAPSNGSRSGTAPAPRGEVLSPCG